MNTVKGLGSDGRTHLLTVVVGPPPESTLDYTGYDFWLTKLNQFNGNYVNAEVVKAFLSSIEYRQRFGP